MKTLFKLAMTGLLTAVLVKWAQRRIAETDLPTLSPVVGGGPVDDWVPDAAEPLRGDNLSVEPPVAR